MASPFFCVLGLGQLRNRRWTLICLAMAPDPLSRAGLCGFAGPLGAMDGAHEPYLSGIWQFRCREPTWAAVRAWI